MATARDLVVVPGLGSDIAVWSRTIEALGTDARCTVGDTLQNSSLADMAHRILATAPDSFVLAGLSMGGMVALEIVRAAPARVRGLALVDSSAFPDTHEQAEQRHRTIAALRGGVDLRAAGEASLAWLVHPDAAPDVRDEIVEMGVRVGVKAYIRQVEAVLGRSDQQHLLASIDVPTSIMSGADDVMIPPSRAAAMAGMIPQAELAVIPDCGHLPPIEKPQTTAELLRGLFSRVYD